MQFVRTWARCILTGRVAEVSVRNRFTRCCQIGMKGVCPVTHPPAMHGYLSCLYPCPRLILSDITSLTISEMVACFTFRVPGFKEKLAHSDHSGSLLKHACVLNRFNRVWLCANLWTVACQAPLSTRFPRQEYWSGLPCPSPGDLPNPGLEPASHVSYIGRRVLCCQHHPFCWRSPAKSMGVWL